MSHADLRPCPECRSRPSPQYFMMTISETEAIVRYRIKCLKCKRTTPWRSDYMRARWFWNSGLE